MVGAAALAGFPEDVIKRTARRCADLFGEGMVIRRLDEAPASRGPGFHTTEYRPERIRLSSTASSASSSSDEEARPTLRQRRLASLASSPSTPAHSRGRAPGRSATPAPATTSGRAPSSSSAPAAAAAGSRSRTRSRSSAGLLFCPVSTCDRAATGFARRANLRRHMHLVHPEGTGTGVGAEDERDSEDEAVGAVHVDGFLRTIQVGRGWRAEDVAERKRKAFWRGRPVRSSASRSRPQSSDDVVDDDGDDEAADDESS